MIFFKKMTSKQEAEKYKTLGNEFFTKKQYIPAVDNYTKAIELAPVDDPSFLAILHGNRLKERE
jgi:hypothetical protein